MMPPRFLIFLFLFLIILQAALNAWPMNEFQNKLKQPEENNQKQKRNTLFNNTGTDEQRGTIGNGGPCEKNQKPMEFTGLRSTSLAEGFSPENTSPTPAQQSGENKRSPYPSVTVVPIPRTHYRYLNNEDQSITWLMKKPGENIETFTSKFTQIDPNTLRSAKETFLEGSKEPIMFSHGEYRLKKIEEKQVLYQNKLQESSAQLVSYQKELQECRDRLILLREEQKSWKNLTIHKQEDLNTQLNDSLTQEENFLQLIPETEGLIDNQSSLISLCDKAKLYHRACVDHLLKQEREAIPNGKGDNETYKNRAILKGLEQINNHPNQIECLIEEVEEACKTLDCHRENLTWIRKKIENNQNNAHLLSIPNTILENIERQKSIIRDKIDFAKYLRPPFLMTNKQEEIDKNENQLSILIRQNNCFNNCFNNIQDCLAKMFGLQQPWPLFITLNDYTIRLAISNNICRQIKNTSDLPLKTISYGIKSIALNYRAISIHSIQLPIYPAGSSKADALSKIAKIFGGMFEATLKKIRDQDYNEADYNEAARLATEVINIIDSNLESHRANYLLRAAQILVFRDVEIIGRFENQPKAKFYSLRQQAITLMKQAANLADNPNPSKDKCAFYLSQAGEVCLDMRVFYRYPPDYKELSDCEKLAEYDISAVMNDIDDFDALFEHQVIALMNRLAYRCYKKAADISLDNDDANNQLILYLSRAAEICFQNRKQANCPFPFGRRKCWNLHFSLVSSRLYEQAATVLSFNLHDPDTQLRAKYLASAGLALFEATGLSNYKGNEKEMNRLVKNYKKATLRYKEAADILSNANDPETKKRAEYLADNGEAYFQLAQEEKKDQPDPQKITELLQEVHDSEVLIKPSSDCTIM